MAQLARIMGYCYVAGSAFFALSGNVMAACVCLFMFFIMDMRADVTENQELLKPLKLKVKENSSETGNDV